MKKAVSWVKDALADKDLVLHLTHYLVKDDMIHASDGRMVAAHPFPFAGEFLVPGEAFEKLLFAMPVEDPEMRLDERTLFIQHNRFKGRIATIDAEQWPHGLENVGKKWIPMGEEVVAALQKVRPFVSDNATQRWATAVGLVPGFAYATNNIVIARSPIKGFKGDLLLPVWAVDFILKRTEGLVAYAIVENAILFKWENNAWMKTVVVDGSFPDKAGGIIDGAKPPKTKIEDEWRETFDRLAGLVENDELYLGKTMIKGGSGEAMEVEDEAETPIPKGETSSTWNPKYLRPVIAAATHWNPAAWPLPARFKGEGIEGIIVGRRKQ